MESTTQEIMKKYEKEIALLHQQVLFKSKSIILSFFKFILFQLSKLKSEYTKLQKKFKKSSKKGSSSGTSSGEITTNFISNNLIEIENSENLFEPPDSSNMIKLKNLNAQPFQESKPSFNQQYYYNSNDMTTQKNFVKLTENDQQINLITQNLNSQKLKYDTEINHLNTLILDLAKDKEKMSKTIEAYKKINQVKN
jgi:hypothetical protein